MYKLGMAGTENKIIINTVNGSKSSSCFKLFLKVQGMHCFAKLLDLPEVLAVDTLPNFSKCISSQAGVDRYRHLAGIKISKCESKQVELLIGADVIEAHECLGLYKGNSGDQPVGVLTCLGWKLFGPDMLHEETGLGPAHFNFLHVQQQDIDDVKSLKPSISIQRSVNNDYETKLSWKLDNEAMPQYVDGEPKC